MKKLFKWKRTYFTRIQNSPELECLQQEVLELAAAKINLTSDFACFSQLDTSVRLQISS